MLIPRGAQIIEFMGRNGLIGKIHPTSVMTKSEIMKEICSVFFAVLQPTGGSSKSLNMPALSLSFEVSI